MTPVFFYTEDANIDLSNIKVEFHEVPIIGDHINIYYIFETHSEDRKEILEELDKNDFYPSGIVIKRYWQIDSNKTAKLYLQIKLEKKHRD